MNAISRRDLLITLAASAAVGRTSQGRPIGIFDLPAPPRLVLLVTWDTVRKANLQVYGYPCPTTPRLAGLTERGVLFTNAFTHANETQTSHAAMLSGLYSYLNQSYRNLQRWSLPAGHLTLAQELAAAGFATVAVTSFGALTAAMIGDGFQQFHDIAVRERTAEETNGVVFEELATLAGTRQRVFLWVHYFDAHEPYGAPAAYQAPFSRRGSSSQAVFEYDREVSYLDHHLGRLIDYLRLEGWYDDAVIAVTNDHGEHFGETPGLPLEAHYGLYEYNIQSLLLYAGGWIERWRRGARLRGTCSELVSAGLTIMPTLLECVGRTASSALSGESLLRVMAGGRGPGAHLSESDSKMQVAVRTKREKLIVLNGVRYAEDLERLARHDPNVYVTARVLEPIRDRMTSDGLELYDLEADPGERRNLANRDRTTVDRHLLILARMRNLRATLASPHAPANDRLDILRSLGYIK